MYQEAITPEDGETYQRLTLPGGSNYGAVGYPEIPCLSKLLAVPKCDSMNVSLTVSDSLIFDHYNIYPVPAMIPNPNNGGGNLIEQFVKNDSIYGLDQLFPMGLYQSQSGGYLRSQKVQKMTGFPFHYDPQTQQLIVYTTFTITILFQNPQSSVTVNNGLFNKLCQSTLLNFQDQPIPPIPAYPNPNPGTVTWLPFSYIQDTSKAKDIVADYLIITDDQFVNPNHSSSLQLLADHRAHYNGFDVVIVSVQDILNANYEYDNTPPFDPNWTGSRQVRQFIKRVFDGQHAVHSYDGKLAFVCLVGEASYVGDYSHMLTSYDPDPTCQAGFPGIEWAYNDYYFSCVTKDPITHDWDLLGDLNIGRLPAANETELSNIVIKIRHNENEYSFENWKSINTLAYGGPMSGGNPGPQDTYFNTNLPNWLNSIYNPLYTTSQVSDIDPNYPWNKEYVHRLSTTGSNIVYEMGEGQVDSWCPGQGDCYGAVALTLNYQMDSLHNDGKYPFVIDQACYAGSFVGIDVPLLANSTVNFSPNAGYVAYLGSSKKVSMHCTQPAEFPFTFQEYIFSAIYSNLSTILGEAVLEARIAVTNTTGPSRDANQFQYNLQGDPAYNLMSTGYEITHNITLPPPPPNPQIINISTPITVRSGATLTLGYGTILNFENNGQLVIENGATLAIGDNVSINGLNSSNKIVINGTLSGIGGNNAPINVMYLRSINSSQWGGFEFNNNSLVVNLVNCHIENCSISGKLLSFNASKTGSNSFVFTNSSINLNESSVNITGCTFTNSNISLTNDNSSNCNAMIQNSTFSNSVADAIIRIERFPSYTIQNSTINYDHGTGIDLYYCFSNGHHLIYNNTIQKTGNPQDMSWGVKVYNSIAIIQNNYITNNRYGVSTLNQSQVQLMGNSGASNSTGTQRIINNYQYQVTSADNSFPYYFHNNILQNTPSGTTYLVCYNPYTLQEIDNTDPITDGSTHLIFNVKCNCFDNSDPTSQLYPIGWYQWSVWCPPASCTFMDMGKEAFDSAVVSVDSGQYSVAETQFKAIISNYPGSTYARESAKKLIPLTCVTIQDLNALKTYFDTVVGLNSDSISKHLAYRLKNICDVQQKAYQNAIAWFENDILSPASLNDSIFSLIDLSDTYILMQSDSTHKSSMSNYTGALAQYKPHNLKEYVSRSNEWVKLLFQEKPSGKKWPGSEHSNNGYKLEQNNPNPFAAITQLNYILPESAYVSIRVSNVLGQQMQVIEQYTQDKGNHSVKLDLTGKPDGIYFITLIANQKEVCKIKAIKAN
jgi:hypothetical protein